MADDDLYAQYLAEQRGKKVLAGAGLVPDTGGVATADAPDASLYDQYQKERKASEARAAQFGLAGAPRFAPPAARVAPDASMVGVPGVLNKVAPAPAVPTSTGSVFEEPDTTDETVLGRMARQARSAIGTGVDVVGSLADQAVDLGARAIAHPIDTGKELVEQAATDFMKPVRFAAQQTRALMGQDPSMATEMTLPLVGKYRDEPVSPLEAAGGAAQFALMDAPFLGEIGAGLAKGAETVGSAVRPIGEAVARGVRAGLDDGTAGGLAIERAKARARPDVQMLEPPPEEDFSLPDQLERHKPERDPAYLLPASTGVPEMHPALTVPGMEQGRQIYKEAAGPGIGLPGVQEPITDPARLLPESTTPKAFEGVEPVGQAPPSPAQRAQAAADMEIEARSATPGDVDAYKKARDAGAVPPAPNSPLPIGAAIEDDAELGRARMSESDLAPTRRAVPLEEKEAAIERSAIAKESADAAAVSEQYPLDSPRTPTGALRPNLEKVHPDALEAELTRLQEANGVENAAPSVTAAEHAEQRTAATENRSGPAAERQRRSIQNDSPEIGATGGLVHSKETGFASARVAQRDKAIEKIRAEIARRGAVDEPPGDYVDPKTNRPGYALAGQFGLLLAPGAGALAGAAVAPSGKKAEGAAAGAIGGLALGLGGARALRPAEEAAGEAVGGVRSRGDAQDRFINASRETFGAAPPDADETVLINGVPHRMNMGGTGEPTPIEGPPKGANRPGALGVPTTKAEQQARAKLGATASMGREAPGPAEVADSLERAYSPATRTDEAAETAATLRERMGQMTHDLAVAQQTLTTASKAAEALPVAGKLGVMHAIETGEKQPNASLQPVADGIRKALDNERVQINRTTGKLEQFIADYFPHLWQDPNAASSWLGKIMGSRPFEGSKSFLKQRTIPTVQEGMFPKGVPAGWESMDDGALLKISRDQGGLVPVSFDPVELTMLKLREMRKYRMSQEVLGDLKDRGLLQKVDPEQRLPAGYGLVNDRAFQGYAGPQQVVDLLNNHLSPGLRGKAWYDAYMAVGNTLNSVQLGLSAFHAGMTTVEASVSQNALAVADLFKGDFSRALKTVGKGRAVGAATGAVAGAATTKDGQNPAGRAIAGGVIGALVGGALGQVKRGNELVKAYRADPATLDPAMRQMVESVAKAGGRDLPAFNDVSRKTFRNAVDAKQYDVAARHFLPAMMESLGVPLMQKLVPAQKFAVFSDMAGRDLEGLKAGATPDQVRATLQKSWDSTDNRMGSVNYDNLFWNKAMKDMLHASVRSVGWNWGTFRELGGGAKDLGGYLKDTMSPGKTGEMSKRAQYLIALPMTVGLLGAATQYLYTGTMPETLFDYFHPKTGTSDADGNPNRIVLPTYMKDVFAYGKDIAGERPLHTAGHKLNPLLTLAVDMLTNKDYYGDEIRNGDDPLVQQLGQMASYAEKEVRPFFLQNVTEDTKRGASGLERAATFVGVTPANREDVRSTAQNKLQEILARRTPERTPEESAAARHRGELREMVRTQGAAAAVTEVKRRLAAGELTKQQVKNILESDKQTPLEARFKQLTLPEAERVYQMGDEREKKLWAPLLQKKRQTSRTVYPSLTRQ